MQLAWYADAIGDVLDGRRPSHVHIALGSGRRETIRIADVDAYVRRQHCSARSVRRRPYRRPRPTRVPHCPLCGHRPTCEAQWRADDHLSYVAGIRRSHVDALRAAGIDRLARARRARPDRDGCRRSSPIRSRPRRPGRAPGIDTRSRSDGEIDWRHRDPRRRVASRSCPSLRQETSSSTSRATRCGTADGELIFLFGYLVREGEAWRYETIWAHTPDEERDALERLVGLIEGAYAADPAMHVYHYSHAEPSILSRIAERHRTCEERLDSLLRDASLRRSLPSRPSGSARRRRELRTEVHRTARWVRARQPTSKVVTTRSSSTSAGARICAARRSLRLPPTTRRTAAQPRLLATWLRDNRPPEAPPEPAPRKSRRPRASSMTRAERLRREGKAQALRDLGGEGSLERLLAELLGYHAREDRASGREYHELMSLPPEQRHDDARMLHGLTGDPTDFEVVQRRCRGPRYTLDFPEQEHKSSRAARSTPTPARTVTVVSVDEQAHQIVIERKHDPDSAPAASPASALCPRLLRHPQARSRQSSAWPTRCSTTRTRSSVARDLLARERPRIVGLPRRGDRRRAAGGRRRRHESAHWLDDGTRRAEGLEGGVLTIQGPPGTGKTWLAGRIVAALVADGKTVGVTAQAHKAIDRLLEEISRRFRGEESRSAASATQARAARPPSPDRNVTSADRWGAGSSTMATSTSSRARRSSSAKTTSTGRSMSSSSMRRVSTRLPMRSLRRPRRGEA